MNRAELDELCLSFPGASCDQPFGPEIDTYRVGGKLFAIVFRDRPPLAVNLKCEPLFAEQLRLDFPELVLPGYHMNKRHWNTVVLDAGLPAELEVSLVEDSYDLVVASLPRTRRPVRD